MNYTKVIQQPTSQSEPLFGETQVKNDAGGYVFSASSKQILERFLLLGTEGGTYYCTERKLTLDTTKTILAMLAYYGKDVLRIVSEFSEGQRLPKQDPALFVLALAVTYGAPEVKSLGYKLLPKVARTSTHLFTFLSMVTPLRGWSRGLRTAVANFYSARSVDQLAYQFLKYQNRSGWTHADVLRLTHPVPNSEGVSTLYRYALGKLPPFGHRPQKSNLPAILFDFEAMRSLSSLDRKLAILQESNLTWEMLPSDLLKVKEVWESILVRMPYTALLRNLARMTALGVFSTKKAELEATSKLTNPKEIVASRVHPIAILNAMINYGRGHGDKGSLSWIPNQRILDALDEALNVAASEQLPSGKDIMLAVDVSGSMQNLRIAGMNLNPAQAAAAVATSMLKSDPGCDLVWFNTLAARANVGRRSSYDEVLRASRIGGGTDCASPFELALREKRKYDAFVILTDNQTWSGSKHPAEAFKLYRSQVNPDAKVVVVCMAVNEFDLFAESEAKALQVAGLDTAVPQIISEFLRCG